jgi:predicted Zn-dependent protease
VASLAYSRDMEREADQYAVALLLAAGKSPEPLAQMLEALDVVHKRRNPTQDRRTERDMRDYLSTHPATVERIEAIRQAR